MCPRNTFATGGVPIADEECMNCAPGRISDRGKDQCDDCPSGTYRGVDDGACINCPTNTYSDNGAEKNAAEQKLAVASCVEIKFRAPQAIDATHSLFQFHAGREPADVR